MYAENLDKKIAEFIKSGDKVSLSVWRAIKTEFLNYKTAKSGNIITDDVELKLINKMAAQRKDSFEQYKNAGRMDLAEKENSELIILQSLLPKEPTESEIISMVETFIKDFTNNSNGELPSMKNMKDCMSYI